MIRVVQLLLVPATTWPRIDPRATPTVLRAFFFAFLPVAIASLVFEAWGLVRFGNIQGNLDKSVVISQALAFKYGAFQLGAGLVILLLSSKLIQWIVEGMHIRCAFGPVFLLACYSFCPLYLARCLDAFPAMNTWVCWSLGAIGSVKVLYQGVGFALQPDQTKGFGIYILSSLLILILSGLAHFMALSVLEGRLPF